ncbi:MAG TPA: LysE family transporter [Ferruginibacter sp.]|jgi:threonine/homoserine/homoserine lactone efflux protein|nr:lysine transporter LysE [Chitinophagaceae bacterium]HML56733.1 LysE family transporter [Ferruginibacter sp.]HRN92915.1 LysE family transporter [Ferruginibacter sp.]HRO06482.1 LysE family transporter [Ferruginibacter sp.]HRO96703.1 LysE family transporter [Ferruginibacter sp.]
MTDAVLTGLFLGLALIFSVGPVIFTLIKLRINYGLAPAFYFISGVWLSDLLWILTANFFSSLLGQLNAYKTTIGLLGGIFLMTLGIYYLFFKKYHTKEELDAGVQIGKSTHIRLFLTGFFINTLNPGVIALWFAAAAQTIQNTNQQKLVIFGLCISITVLADILKINLAGKLRRKLTNRNIIIINRAAGILFVVFAVALIAGVLFSKE